MNTLLIEKYGFSQQTLEQLKAVLKEGEKHGLAWKKEDPLDHLKHAYGHLDEWWQGVFMDKDSYQHPIAHSTIRLMMALNNILAEEEENEAPKL